MSEPNELLRQHVLRVGFDLSLGKTHIAALVFLNESIRQRRFINVNKMTDRQARRAFSFFSSGIHGCEERGLVIHHYRADKAHKKDDNLRWHFTITKAGKLVIDLLNEAGIYEEYAGTLPQLEAVS